MIGAGMDIRMAEDHLACQAEAEKASQTEL